MNTKKIIKICLSILLSINMLITGSVAAIVSDNDGSAFVTKAEFDALKNNFNKQIDDYNSSIDGKIDGAIAQYLYGLKLSQTDTRNAICYSEDGIYNVDRNEFCYDKGEMEWAMKVYNVRSKQTGAIDGTSGGISDNLGFFFIEANFSDAPTEFIEMMIDHPDFHNASNAEWLGLCMTMQKLDTNFSMWYDDGFGNVPTVGHKAYLSIIGPRPEGKSTLDSFVGESLCRVGFSVRDADMTADMAYSNSTETFNQAVTFVRTILDTSRTNAILTPGSLYEPRFSNNNGFHDFMNDDRTAPDYPYYHVEETQFDKICDSVTASSKRAGFELTQKGVVDFTIGKYFYKSQTGQTVGTWTKPYAGFDKKVDDYNMLWTPRYDSYIYSIKAANAGLSTGIMTGNDSKEHLALYAGAPLCELKTDEKIVLDLDFEDKGKDYDVWLKFSPFDKKNAWEDDCIDISKIYVGQSTTNAPAGSEAKSVKISNGAGQISWLADKAGILFIKFAEYGKSGLGSAHLNIPNKLTVIKPE